MSVFTFTGAMIADLDYEMNDEDIWNDILLIEGAAGSEQLIRGYSATSIQKYARRSRRIERPLAASEVVGETLVTEQLDKYSCESSLPPPKVRLVVHGTTDELIAQLFTRVISEVVTVQCTEMGMSQDFYIDGAILELTQELVTADYDLVGV
jgi:hypothetical protein